ncbi:MAG: DUF4230 domain-containing protein [Armatimonadota bacterium]
MVKGSVADNRSRALPWILVGVFGTLWVTKGTSAEPTERVSNEVPLIVNSVRELGFLQSAEMNLSDAFQFATSKAASDSVAAVPGLDELVRATTANSVWVQASGTVTAGVDLSKASIRIERDSVHVRLPKTVVQSPSVDLKLLDDKKGIFWKDDEILLRAIREARRRFADSSDQMGIERTAFVGASNSIRKMLAKVTSKEIIVE